ncbi:MAG: magnesium/cobalt transporter CorA [Candidatus Eisenbacteria bacterium]
MITVWIADAQGARTGTLEDAHRVVREHTGNVWIDFDGEEEAVVRASLAPCGVHPLVVEDLVMQVNRPKLDDYTDYVYLVVHSARWENSEDRPTLREVDIVVGEHWIVTYHEGETRSVAAARAVLPKRPALLAKSPAHLMHYILDVLVDHYLPLADRLAEDVDQLEDDVFTDTSASMHARILRLKRGISGLRRIVGPQRDTVLALTRDELRAVPPELRPYLRDVYDRLARVSDLLDSFRDESASVLELHLSASSNRMNEVIKRLTVIATVGLPLTVVTSYYGMNFDFPEYKWRLGEWYALGLMLVTGLATWLFLRSRRWD